MFKKIIGTALFLGSILAATVVGFVPAHATGGHNPLPICHSGSGKNWTYIEPDAQGYNGHKNHQADIYGLTEAECLAKNKPPVEEPPTEEPPTEEPPTEEPPTEEPPVEEPPVEEPPVEEPPVEEPTPVGTPNSPVEPTLPNTGVDNGLVAGLAVAGTALIVGGVALYRLRGGNGRHRT